MQSILKKEKLNAGPVKFVWSPHYHEILTHFLGTAVVDDFTQQWNRVLDKVGFYEYPYSEAAVEQAKSNHFWHQIANEIIESLRIDQVQSKNLPAQFQIDESILDELASNDHFSIEITIDLGRKLLQVHKQLRPEFHR